MTDEIRARIESLEEQIAEALDKVQQETGRTVEAIEVRHPDPDADEMFGHGKILAVRLRLSPGEPEGGRST